MNRQAFTPDIVKYYDPDSEHSRLVSCISKNLYWRMSISLIRYRYPPYNLQKKIEWRVSKHRKMAAISKIRALMTMYQIKLSEVEVAV